MKAKKQLVVGLVLIVPIVLLLLPFDIPYNIYRA